MVSTQYENIFTVDFIAYLQVLIAAAVLLQFLLDEVTIPDDVVCEMVMQTIEEHNLHSLTQKQRRQKGVILFSNNLPKRPCITYSCARVDVRILSDWVCAVPRFSDMQFEHTFRIKHHMVDTILNHLDQRSSFWIKTVCHVVKKQSTGM